MHPIVRGAATTLYLLLVALVAFASVAPSISTDAWWVRVTDFPRIQFCVLGLVLLVGGWLGLRSRRRLRWGVAVVLGIATAVQVRAIAPFTLLAATEVAALDSSHDAERSLSLYVANVQFDRESARSLIASIEASEADIVFLVETDEAWLALLAPLHARYPERFLHARPEGRGLALYSRHPLSNARVRHLSSHKRPSLRATILHGAGEIEFWGLHPAPPGLETKDGDRMSSRQRDVELITVAREIEAGAFPRAIVAGDFNDAAWSPTTREFKSISDMVDPRVGRGFYNTYHADYWFLRYPIDHIFLSRSFGLIDVRVLPSIGSDHLPMFIRIGWE